MEEFNLFKIRCLTLFLSKVGALGCFAVAVVSGATAPTVTLENRDLSVRAGEEVRFSATISGEGSVAIQWYRQGAPVAGGNAAELVIEHARLEDAGTYQVVAENEIGSTLSGGRIELTVRPAVEFTQQPESIAVRVGQPLQLTARAEGEGVSYHWLRGSVELPADENGNLIVESPTLEDAGIYQAVGVGTYGEGRSERVRVDVLPEQDPGVLQFDSDWDLAIEREWADYQFIAPMADGGFILAGAFVRINGHSSTDLVRFNAAGAVDDSFVSSLDFVGQINAVIERPDGKIWVAGRFQTTFRGQTWWNLVQLHADGRIDEAFAPAGSRGVFINAMVADANGRVYVVRELESDQRYAQPRVARLTDAGTIDETFEDPENAPIVGNAIAVSSTGQVFVQSGNFNDPRVHVLSPDGSLVDTLTVPDLKGIRALGLDGSDRLYAIGQSSFSFVVGWRRFNADRTIDAAFSGDGAYILSSSIAVVPTGGLYISSSLLVEYVDDSGVKVATDSTDDLSASTQIILDATGRPVLRKNGWTSVEPRVVLRRYSPGLSESSRLDQSFVDHGRVHHIGRQADGRILIMGDFTHVNGQPRDYAALVSNEGELDDETLAGAFNGFVRQVTRGPADDLYVRGAFSQSFGQQANGLIRINRDGTIDQSFAGNTSIGGLNDMSSDEGFLVTTGGDFVFPASLQIGDDPFRRFSLYRFSSRGVLDPNFHGRVRSWTDSLRIADLVELLDGRIVVSPLWDPFPFSGIFVWLESDGLLAEQPNPVVLNTRDTVRIITDGEDRLWWFGEQGLGRYSRDGIPDTSFAAPAQVVGISSDKGSLPTILRQAEDRMIAFGNMSFRDPGIGTIQRDFATRFNADGSVDERFEIKGLNGPVDSAMQLADGNFILAGNGRLRRTSALVAPSVSVVTGSSNVTGGDTVELNAAVTGFAESYQWYRNGVRLSGADTSVLLIPDASEEDTGVYRVVVRNSKGVGFSEGFTLRVLNPTVNAGGSHRAEQPFGVSGETTSFTVESRVDFTGSPGSMTWSVLVPEGWMLQASEGSGADNVPPDAATSLAEWTWVQPSSSPLVFSYTLTPPADARGRIAVAGLLSVSDGGSPTELMARPDPLYLHLRKNTLHTADLNGVRALDLGELLRVIQIYNARNGTTRTGRYALNERSVDGFDPDFERPANAAPLMDHFHRADSNRDATLSLSELLRVIEIYNTRIGTRRTGAYLDNPDSVDGFEPDRGSD
ncbi:MAG: hypothetical protein SynsKO_01250 [Synoicihabitans sp.]